MPKPSRSFIASLAVAAACFALLAATSPILPMTWDEGNAIHRAEGIRHWFGRFGENWTAPFWTGLFSAGPFSKQAIDDDWRYTTKIEGHPAFYGTVIAAGQSLGEKWFAPLDAARFGPMALFALAVAAAVYRLWRMISPVAALAGAAALITLPRLFAHAHFASFDGPLTSCWLLAWATFEPAQRKAGWSTVWGAALGMTMSCKFTGWLAPLPFVFWVAAFGDRHAARRLAIGLLTAGLTFWALNPPLWHAPLDGFATFLDLNLGRADRPALNIPTMYLGRRYDARSGAPWHNTIVWTAITVPVGTLALFALGLFRSLGAWRIRPERLLLVGHWAILVLVRATPWAPPHDAERLFLPSFAFLALLAGVGGDALWAWCNAGPTLGGGRPRVGGKANGSLRHGVSELRTELLRVLPRVAARRWLMRGAVVAALAGSASSTIWYAPQWLCYYNLLVGGLRGADALGMEATYYWDGLDAEVLAWLHEHTEQDEKIAFAPLSWANLELMRRWGTLRRNCFPHEPGRYRWYVVQRRPGFWSEADRRLVEHGRPVFRKTIRPAGAGWGPWRLDVPIVEVFDYVDYKRAAGSIRPGEAW